MLRAGSNAKRRKGCIAEEVMLRGGSDAKRKKLS